MKKLIIISIFSLFIFSCDDDDNPMEPLSCDEGLTEFDGECVDQCGVVNGNNYVDEICGSCSVNLWGDGDYCFSIQETTSLEFLNFILIDSYMGEDSILTDSIVSLRIPPEIGNLTNLTYLDLSSTQLTGEIPSEIENLTDLIWLRLFDNQLTGEIPSNLTNLEYLGLYSNQFTGEIPSDISNLTNLIYLGLSDNELTGEIPSEIGNMTNLLVLTLYNNQLSGQIPEEVCNLIENNNLIITGITDGNNLTNTCD